MDALDFLHADHESIKSMIDRVKMDRTPSEKSLNQIEADFMAHSHIEETVFYPTFRNYDEIKEIIDRSFEQHANIKSELYRCRDHIVKGEAQEAERCFQAFDEAVRTHIQEEEYRLFPLVRKIMKRPERERLGRLLEGALQERKLAA